MPSNTQFVEHVLANTHPDRVYAVEDGRVWVSGMNANCRRVAEDMARSLSDRGVPCGLVHTDGAAEHGGVYFAFGDSDDDHTEAVYGTCPRCFGDAAIYPHDDHPDRGDVRCLEDGCAGPEGPHVDVETWADPRDGTHPSHHAVGAAADRYLEKPDDDAPDLDTVESNGASPYPPDDDTGVLVALAAVALAAFVLGLAVGVAV